MQKLCGRCGRLHEVGTVCCQGKRYAGGPERRLRSRYAWALKSQEIRERANYLCEVCRDRGRITDEGLEVHHIRKLKDNEELLLEDSNLICLCSMHHREADAGRIDATYLIDLARRRDADIPPCL